MLVFGQPPRQSLQDRRCPENDNHLLNTARINGVDFDICPDCYGVFFDETKLRKVIPTFEQNKIKSGSYITVETMFWGIVAIFSGVI